MKYGCCNVQCGIIQVYLAKDDRNQKYEEEECFHLFSIVVVKLFLIVFHKHHALMAAQLTICKTEHDNVATFTVGAISDCI